MRRGDIVELGRHRLVCGDAFNAEHVDLLMAGEEADMLYCDPPYGIGHRTGFHALKPYPSASVTPCPPAKKYARIIGDDGPFDPSHIMVRFSTCHEQFWWGGDYYKEHLPGGSWIVWDKRVTEAGDRAFGSCFELCWSRKKHRREIARVRWCGLLGTEKEPWRKRVHPTQKPVGLCEWFLERYSGPDAVVVDLFAGSGSTLLACERMGRRARVMEIAPSYCEMIVERWRALVNPATAPQLPLALPRSRERRTPAMKDSTSYSQLRLATGDGPDQERW